MPFDPPGDWQRLYVERGGAWTANAGPESAPVLLPGSFHPAHAGHWGLAAVAAEMLGRPTAFEISVVNVDKAEMPFAEARRRAAQFLGRADVWLTRAARFVEKARLFPGATFVLGADTAARLVDARYYQHDAGVMLAALAEMAAHDCRFLVAARVDAAGRCWSLDDLPIPSVFADRMQQIPIERFRLDVSSTQIRAETANEA